jgi:Zn finger protein HypA/HybF involved in hydrogenase expression
MKKKTIYKIKCPLCKRFFIPDNGNKILCYKCRPSDKNVKKMNEK